MKTLSDVRKILQDKKPTLLNEFGVTEIGIFGSYVRGEQSPDSDVDILIDLEVPVRISLLDLMELQNLLTESLGIDVDIALKKNLRKRIGRRILDEVVPV